MPYLDRSRFFAVVIGIFLLQASIVSVAKEPAEPVWIDVRSWVEHQTDHIEGDTRYHYTDILESVSAVHPNKTTPIKLYCAVGGRAQKALITLQEAGYSNVENAGGIDDVRKTRGLSSSD